MQPTEEETKSTEEATEPTEEATEPTEEATEPTEEETEPTEEETEPAEPELLSLEAPDLDAEELLMGYLSPLYHGEGASFFGTVGRDRLSAVNQYLYDGMKEQIARIAAGLQPSTYITVSYAGTNLNGAEADIILVLHALTLDCPFEMYWYDGCLYYPPAETIRILMTPNTYYQADNFDEYDPYIDTAKARNAAAAAENISDIISKYETSSDYDKLCAYADEICALVEYDHDAADNNTYTTDISPWTLINVFDGDTTTNVVCEGYAEAYQYLCDESTFQGDVVCASATGNSHKWNILRIDGVSYLMDVTHCDDGDSAYRGPKFFGGGSGSVADGYVIGDFHYWYDPVYTLPVYGDGEDSILKLSPISYSPPVTYSIVFDANGGTGAPGSQLKTQGIDLILRDTVPSWDGYTFLGWATSSTATAAEYQPSDVYNAEGDVTLYAVWEKTVCTHSFGDYTTVKEPTCEEPGTEERSCSLCGETESQEIPAAGHEKVTVPGTAATCTTDGLTDGVQCSVCGEVITKQKVIPAGHTVVDGICTACQVYGTCGENLTWTLDEEGTMTISGTGDMFDYERKTAPWYAPLKDQIGSVVFDGDITHIGDNAFSYCALHSVEIPDTVCTIGADAFLLCTDLNSIYITDLAAWCNIEFADNPLHQGADLYLDKTLLTSCIIPDGVTAIPDGLFTNCTSLINVTIPGSVTSIGTGVFYGCSNLTDITLSNGVPSIGASMFSDCSNLTNISIPCSVTSIGENAFYRCSGIVNINIPEGVTSIGNSAFSGCQNLSTINIPNTVTSIGNTAFAECSITNVLIPDSITCIDEFTFVGCRNLTSITIPDSIISIGVDAFAYCANLANVIFEGDAPEFSAGCFYNDVATIYYPANNDTWTSDVMLDYGGTITWVPYGGVENQVTIPAAELGGHTSVWIDGKEYAVNTDSGMPYVDLPDGNAKTMVAYTYQNGEDADVHTHIPTGMTVWTLSNTDGLYTAARVEELDDMLGYQGCSIRIKGNQGIRMITSIDQTDKDALTTVDLAGYTLEEYGTAVAWASQLSSTRPLILGKNYVSSNYAYKKDVADPIFGSDGNVMQYTNVLVGFTLDQCRDDLAMRPYMILKNADGETITLYGAIVERSIGYIARQNTENVEEGTEAYDYVWNIITHVYGEVPEA